MFLYLNNMVIKSLAMNLNNTNNINTIQDFIKILGIV